jgi:hypothetical protein
MREDPSPMNGDELRTFLQEQVSLFRGFPPERVQQVADGSRFVSFEPHEAMVEFGEDAVHAPIRDSGDLDHTPGVTLEGPAGSVAIDRGVICAVRHIQERGPCLSFVQDQQLLARRQFRPRQIRPQPSPRSCRPVI